MYSFAAIRGKVDQWWVVAISWENPNLYVTDSKLAQIIGMDSGNMATELVKNHNSNVYANGSTYWLNEKSAQTAIQEFFQPRLTAHLLNKNNNKLDENFINVS